MIREREPTFIAAVGMTGVGKTYQNLIQMRNVILGYGMMNKVTPRKVLLLDNNLEYVNDNKDVLSVLGPYGIRIKTIHYKQVPAFTRQDKIEICRVIPVDDNGQLLDGKQFGNTLNYVLKNFMGGFIVGEDFKAFTGNSLNEQLIGLLATRRHKGCDTLVSLQGANMIQPTLLTVLKWIRLHKSLDPIERSEKFKGKVELLSIAENLVNNRYKLGGENERFFVKVELQKSMITGQYTREEFDAAAKQYVFENYTQTVKKKMAWRDEHTGKPIFTQQGALKEVLNDIRLQYSQYSPRYAR